MRKKEEFRNIEYTEYISSKLGFSISIPSNWRVDADGLIEEEKEEKEEGLTLKEVYDLLRQEFRNTMSFEEFKRKVEQGESPFGVFYVTETEFKQKKERAERLPSAREAYQKFLENHRAFILGFEKFKKLYEKDKKKAYRAFLEKSVGMPTDIDIEKKYVSKNLSVEEAYMKLIKEPRTYLAFDVEKASILSFKKFKKLYEEDKKKAYKEFFEKYAGMPTNNYIEKEYVSRNLSAEEAYKKLMEDPKTFPISFKEFEQQYKEEQERERKEEELSQMKEGYFEASPPDDKDSPFVEVTKLKLTRPMTPLELYQLVEPYPDAESWGNRFPKGITVDGLQGIKYNYKFNIGKLLYMAELPQSFIVYLTDKQVGWIISCSCLVKAFPKYKGIFTKIISSFHRI